jgi:hypothetical protein
MKVQGKRRSCSGVVEGVIKAGSTNKKLKIHQKAKDVVDEKKSRDRLVNLP